MKLAGEFMRLTNRQISNYGKKEGRNNKKDRKDLRQDLRTKLVYTSDKRISLPSTIADDRARPYSAINIVI